MVTRRPVVTELGRHLTMTEGESLAEELWRRVERIMSARIHYPISQMFADMWRALRGLPPRRA